MRYDISRIKEYSPEIRKIVYLKTCDSTNKIARVIAEDEESDGILILTDSQTYGRGRLGRTWIYSDGGIAMSYLFRPELEVDSLPMITLAAAIAVHDALKESAGLETQIKWPNDILVDGRKLCGILTEGVLDGEKTFAVLGVGMNVNQEQIPEEIASTAVSVKMLTGNDSDREAIIGTVIKYFNRYVGILKEDGDLRSLKETYNRLCIPGNEINEKGQIT